MELKTSESVRYIQKIAKGFFEHSKGSHDWDHTLRVCALCERIGAAEKADGNVLQTAALLHDIGRSQQDQSAGKICHAEKGAELAVPVVQRLPFSKEQQENILHCIRSHRFRGAHLPRTNEAKVLFDADKLDAIGAIGVARAYLFAGEIGARLHCSNTDIEKAEAYSENDTGYREFRVKLSRIRNRMLTPTGRDMARERHAFMERFFEQFLREYQGEI